MCFGGGDESSSSNDEIFNQPIDIYLRFKYNSKITANKYIDPVGYEYNRNSFVSCRRCVFSYGLSRCIMHKQNGWSDSDINSAMNRVYQEKYCDYFLTKNFSEGDNEDEIAQNASYKFKKKLYD